MTLFLRRRRLAILIPAFLTRAVDMKKARVSRDRKMFPVFSGPIFSASSSVPDTREPKRLPLRWVAPPSELLRLYAPALLALSLRSERLQAPATFFLVRSIAGVFFHRLAFCSPLYIVS